MNILVLQPIRPSNPPALRKRADMLLERMVKACPMYSFDIAQDDSAIEIPSHHSLYMRHATVRNHMLDTYLCPSHTHVLWIDSDLIEYPANLPTLLHEAAPGAICAPLAVLDESVGRMSQLPGRERFYDIGGFIEKGNRARAYPPWFVQRGEVIELDSVGCCYLAPARLYRDDTVISETDILPSGLRVSRGDFMPAARYKPPPTDYYVEHWSVMQEARKRGYRVCCLTTARAIHAWLPDYGLEAN